MAGESLLMLWHDAHRSKELGELGFEAEVESGKGVSMVMINSRDLDLLVQQAKRRLTHIYSETDLYVARDEGYDDGVLVGYADALRDIKALDEAGGTAG